VWLTESVAPGTKVFYKADITPQEVVSRKG
jgi:hypothetical protein